MACIRGRPLRGSDLNYPTFQPSRVISPFNPYSLTTMTIPIIQNSLRRSAGRRVSLAIRREDPERIWERRVPLTPDAVYHLVSKHNVDVQVMPCHRRVFPNQEYEKAGARVESNPTLSNIVLGIKETRLSELKDQLANLSRNPLDTTAYNDQTHLMFSHTAKGQPYNTPLLSQFVAPLDETETTKLLRPRLIDYELLTNGTDGKRTVGFGWFAGVAGVLESLSAMAHSHLEIGVASPFLYTPRPHTLPSLERLRAALREIGDTISKSGTPPKLGPFVIGLTGRGNVAEGCLFMLSELPIQMVNVADLDDLVKNPETDLRKIYLIHAKPEDYFIGVDGSPYDRARYYASPQSYISVFAEKVAPYLTLFLNGTGWSPSFPRLMTNEQLTVALERARQLGGARFTNIGDISCDVEGGLEFMTKATTLSAPFFKTRPTCLPAEYPPVQIMSVDILPASIPLDASQHFSRSLLPYLESLIGTFDGPKNDEFTAALEKATIAKEGKLADKHLWLQSAVNVYHAKAATTETNGKYTEAIASTPRAEPETTAVPQSPRTKKKVLMLGSGMVAGPAVNTIAKRGDVELVIASNSLQELQTLVGLHLNVKYRIIDVSKTSSYEHLVKDADVVISLLPATMHADVAELCVLHRKHMVTASYTSDEMNLLNDRAIHADVLLLNEIGLDPGIDHCSHLDLVSRLQQKNKEVVSFISFCGGLPAPENSNVPLRYKFSWRPHGVLTAALNSARYKINNSVHSVYGEKLLRSQFPNVPITDEFKLEGLPNRDSLIYNKPYGIFGERTMLRGTLRYPGFSNLMDSFVSLGLLERNETIWLEGWTSLVSQAMSLRYPSQIDPPDIKEVIRPSQLEALTEALEWLGLAPPTIFSLSRVRMPTLPDGPMTPLDLFAYLLSEKLRYAPHERDMVVLSHEVITREKGLGPRAPETVYTSSLITFGGIEGSAMARTVGIPVAIAALNVLDGKVHLRGVVGPTHRSIYEPVLSGLEEAGLGMKETARTIRSGLADTIEKTLIVGEGSRKMEYALDGDLATNHARMESSL